ncbi:MAG: amidohydrolase family protein [Chloroflexi bacterium]|nr:amidohydrolase family protein [Chloroflexota bacterium]
MKVKTVVLMSLITILTLFASQSAGILKAAGPSSTAVTLAANMLGQSAPEQMQRNTITAFVNVNVIPMDSERVLENQTVVVENGRITTIGAVDEVTVPDGAEIVEGNGAYLMPGLADMHVHLNSDPDPNSLQLYLAQGVTTVRNFNSIPKHLEWREQVASGELLGPTILTSGNTIVGVPRELKNFPYIFRAITLLTPIILGLLIWLIIWSISKFTSVIDNFGQVKRFMLPSLGILLLIGLVLVWAIPLTTFIHPIIDASASVPESEAEARKFVREQKADGVDFIKPYDFLELDIYLAALDEAEKEGMYTAGHILDGPDIVTLEELIENGFDESAHVDELTHEFWPDYDPAAEEWVDYEVDMSRLDEVAALVADNDIAVTLTLITNETVLLGLEDMDGLLQQPQYQVMRPETIESWRTGGRFVNWQGQEAYRRDEWRPLLMALTKALHDQGALLNLGTDVSVEGIVPGHSAHLELPLLVEAGLSPFEALSLGTRNPAETAVRMGANGDWGTITAGNHADLILLLNNPLEDVTHTQERLGVMVRGQWFTQAELDNKVGAFVAAYGTDGS